MLTSLSLTVINEQTFSSAASGGPYTSIPSGDIGTIIRFYTNWASYLHLNYGFWHSACGTFMNWVVKTIFEADKGLEAIYNSIFMLLGWEGNVAHGGPLHTIWVFFQAVGWSLLALGLTIVALQSLNHHTNWGSIATNMIMVAATMTVLPLMMQMFNTIAVDAEKGINSISNTEMTSDVAIQPIKNNVIDLTTLVRNNFNGFTYKPDSKTIKSVADWNVIHTSKDIKEMDLGQSLDNQTMKDLKLDKYKAGSAALQYHLEDEHSQNGGGYVIVKNKAGAGAGSLNDQCYARYSVNWIGLIGQALILGFVLIAAGIRLVKDMYELALMHFIAPLLAYRSIRSTKKLRDLISSIAGMYTSIVFMIAIIRVYLISLPVCQAKIPSMNWFQRSIVVLIIYIGGAVAIFAGVNYLERVTGVSQGLTDEAGQLIAAGATGLALTGAAGGLMGGAMGATGGMISRLGNRNNSTSHHSPGGLIANSHSARNNSSSAGHSSAILPGHNSKDVNNQGNLQQEAQNNRQNQANNQSGLTANNGVNNNQANNATNQASETADNDIAASTSADGVPGVDGSQGDITTDTTSPDGVPGNVDGDTNIAGDDMNTVSGTESMENNSEAGADPDSVAGTDGLAGTDGSNSYNNENNINEAQANGSIPGTEEIDGNNFDNLVENLEGSSNTYGTDNVNPDSVTGGETIDNVPGSAVTPDNSGNIPGTEGLEGNNMSADPTETGMPENSYDMPPESTSNMGDTSEVPGTEDMGNGAFPTNSYSANDSSISGAEGFNNTTDPNSYSANNLDSAGQTTVAGTGSSDAFNGNQNGYSPDAQSPIKGQTFNENPDYVSNNNNGFADTSTNIPTNSSFEAQTDRLNTSEANTNMPANDTGNRFDQASNSNPIHSSQPVIDNRGTGAIPHTTPHNTQPAAAPTAVKVGHYMQRAGHEVSHVSSSLRRHSTNYLRNHRFNLSQSGNLHGRDSEHLE